MEFPVKTRLRVGAWCVNPATGEITREEETVRLEARAMLLLLCLSERPGEVVSMDELLRWVWPDVAVSPDSVYQAVTSLRRQLGDDPKRPNYIATVPRLGYRMVAKVTPWVDDVAEHSGSSRAEDGADASKIDGKWALAAVVIVALAILASWSVLAHKRVSGKTDIPAAVAPHNERSIAVLPFLDLTDGMKEEEFADGMTEELIDRLSKIPDFRLPAATSSFYYKGKQVPLGEIAKALGVVYVLDGSVRKSAERFRVSARLVRAENGFVIWSQDYDRPLGDKLWVQEDIATEAAKALRTSIESESQGQRSR